VSPAVAAAAPGLVSEQSRPDSREQRPPRILVVDDDEDIRALVSRALARGYEVAQAGDGPDALELVASEAPDLVVLDWRLPGRHGALVLDEIKEREPALPVVVLTAEGGRSQRALADALAADAFLAKPFSVRELLETVSRLLAR
jgi:DNA-binding response OmpR family regulator